MANHQHKMLGHSHRESFHSCGSIPPFPVAAIPARCPTGIPRGPIGAKITPGPDIVRVAFVYAARWPERGEPLVPPG